MNSNQPSVGVHRDQASTTHSKYSFAKTPRFPSNNAMYPPHHPAAPKPSTPLNQSYPTAKPALAMDKKYSFRTSCPKPPPPIATASIPASSRPKVKPLDYHDKNPPTSPTSSPRFTNILVSEKYIHSYKVRKPNPHPHASGVLPPLQDHRRDIKK